MRKVKLLVAGLAAASLAACFEVEYPYRYISVEQVPGIRVDRIAQIEQEKLHGNSPMPVEYSLAREFYTLRFSIVNDSVHPALNITVEGGDYSLQFGRDVNVRAPNGAICASFYRVTKASFDFGWEPGCTDPALPKVIDFDVRDSDDAVVGRERIGFSLMKNGFYTAVDAL